MSLFSGTDADRQTYAELLKDREIFDVTEVVGNLGATLRPLTQQAPFFGGQSSQSSSFEVYISPVGTDRTDKAKNVGHELFSHVFLFFTNRDPRHGGITKAVEGNPQLDEQIKDREQESKINSNDK